MKADIETLVALLGSLTLVACGGSSDPASTDVTQWLGDKTHLAITGTLATAGPTPNMNFDVHLEGDAAAGVYCFRYYAPMPGSMPDAMGKWDTSKVYFAMKELGGVIDIGDQKKEFTISYWRHDVPADTTLQVVPRTFNTPIPDGQTWSDINIFPPGGNVLDFETAASSGTVAMKLNGGTPDENGVMVPAGGRTGEFVSVSWGPHDSLNISATAECKVVVAPWMTNLVPM